MLETYNKDKATFVVCINKQARDANLIDLNSVNLMALTYSGWTI